MGPIDQSISAGLGGFLALFLLAAALWLLMRSLLKHLRNAEHHKFEHDDEQAGAQVPAGVVRSRPSAATREGAVATGEPGGVTGADAADAAESRRVTQQPDAPQAPGEASRAE